MCLQRIDRTDILAGEAHHIGDDVGDMGITLDNHFLGQSDRSGLSNTPDIVPAEVDEHQVFGDFFFVTQQIRFKGFILGDGITCLRVPAIGRTVTSPSSSRTKISGEDPTI